MDEIADKLSTLLEKAEKNQKEGIILWDEQHGYVESLRTAFSIAKECKYKIPDDDEDLKGVRNYYLNIEFQEKIEKFASDKITIAEFINYIDQFVNKGCPNAVYLKGQYLLGNLDKAKEVLGGKSDVLYKKDFKSGIDLINQLKEKDSLVFHPNSSKSMSVWTKEDKQQYSLNGFIDTIKIQEKYEGKAAEITDANKNSNSTRKFFTRMAHRYFTDPKRTNQIALLQSIIDNKMIPSGSKAAILLGAMDAIKAQIGTTKYQSRLLSVMEEIERKMPKDTREHMTPEIRTQAFTEYLHQALNNSKLDKNYIGELITQNGQRNDQKQENILDRGR